MDKVDSNAELGMENGQVNQQAGVGDTSSTDRTKNDDTGNVKNQKCQYRTTEWTGNKSDRKSRKLHLDIMF